jgi:hypothetical protein
MHRRLHPHPRVTAVAKKDRNRRAACPILQLSGRGIFKKAFFHEFLFSHSRLSKRRQAGART